MTELFWYGKTKIFPGARFVSGMLFKIVVRFSLQYSLASDKEEKVPFAAVTFSPCIQGSSLIVPVAVELPMNEMSFTFPNITISIGKESLRATNFFARPNEPFITFAPDDVPP